MFLLRHARVLAVMFVLGILAADNPLWAADPPAKPSKSVKLTIDFGDGFQKRYTSIAYRESMTVLDQLLLAAKHAHPLKFKHRGRGETAFVSEIDAIENEGTGRNWIFRVNGKLGKRSCGATKLKAGDEVSWRFERYRPRE